MFDPKALLEKFLGNAGNPGSQGQPGWTDGKFGGFAGGALAGGLLGALLGTGTGRSIGGSVVKIGGIAALGALAYKAYRDWQAGREPGSLPQTAGAVGHTAPVVTPPPPGSPFLPNPTDTAAANRQGTALLRAMIAGAKADGHIDADERRRIADTLDKTPLTADERRFLDAEIARPLDIDSIVAGADSPELAAQIYAASLLAMVADSPAERDYLAKLAAGLRLEQSLVDHIHANVRPL